MTARAVAIPVWAWLTIPVWGWLTILVIASALARFAIARPYGVPWIASDEFIYTELGRTFAFHGTFDLRGVPVSGYSTLYPVLIAPVYRIFANQVDAYTAVKAVNAVVVSLTAIPVYLLARRLVKPGLALVASVLALAIADMFFSAMVMTENLFYPLFMLLAYLLVLVLERPTIVRQLLLLAVLALTVLTRLQAAALVPAILTAVLLRALLETRASPAGGRLKAARRVLVPILPTIVLVCAAVVGIAAYEIVRGRGIDDLLGTYGTVSSSGYSVGTAATYFLRHLVDIDLLTGVVPFAAFLLIAARSLRAGATDAERAFVAAAVSLVFWLVLVVSLFASTLSQRVEERLLFYVAPLFFVALVAWIGGRSSRSIGLVVAAGVAAALPATINLSGLISKEQLNDALSILPLVTLNEHGLTASQISWIVLGGVAAAAVLFLLVPTDLRAVLPMLLLAVFALESLNVDARIRHDDGIFSSVAFGRELDLDRRRRRSQRGHRLPLAVADGDAVLAPVRERVLQPIARPGLPARGEQQRPAPGYPGKRRAERPVGRRRRQSARAGELRARGAQRHPADREEDRAGPAVRDRHLSSRRTRAAAMGLRRPLHRRLQRRLDDLYPLVVQGRAPEDDPLDQRGLDDAKPDGGRQGRRSGGRASGRHPRNRPAAADRPGGVARRRLHGHVHDQPDRRPGRRAPQWRHPSGRAHLRPIQAHLSGGGLTRPRIVIVEPWQPSELSGASTLSASCGARVTAPAAREPRSWSCLPSRTAA